jgi:hypothetical protein
MPYTMPQIYPNTNTPSSHYSVSPILISSDLQRQDSIRTFQEAREVHQ